MSLILEIKVILWPKPTVTCRLPANIFKGLLLNFQAYVNVIPYDPSGKGPDHMTKTAGTRIK